MYLFVFPSREYAVGSVAGVLASTVSIVAAHPVEAVKVRLQSGERGSSPAERRNAWRRLLALLRRPYCGIGPHLLQYSALNFVRFGSFAAARAHVERRRGHGVETPLPLQDIFACGAFSGACIAATLHPLWVLKTHQQANRLGAVAAAGALWRGEGLRGFFRGYVSGFARFPFALGVFFASYEALKRGAVAASTPAVPPPKSGGSPSIVDTTLQLAGRAGSGAVAGVLCWTSIYPLDVVQSRMMGEAAYGDARVYRSALSSFRRIWATEGLASFARGYSAVLIRSGPVNAVLLPVSDAAHPLMDRWLPP